jgi:hypothetical protein
LLAKVHHLSMKLILMSNTSFIDLSLCKNKFITQ